MKTILAPDGKTIVVPEGRITTFGLTGVQNELVQSSLPSKGYELYATDVATDLIAIPAETLIINASALGREDLELLLDFYAEIASSVDESVFWLGEPKPPKSLRRTLKCYDSFDDIAVNLKYRFLTAHNKVKKNRDFSKKLADSLLILSLIRLYPGIRTQELSERIELPTRTVQRYISTLQAAGEWIEYDTMKRGWQLQYGKSILFGDYLDSEQI